MAKGCCHILLYYHHESGKVFASRVETLMMVVKVVVKSTELNARDGDSVGR